MTGLPNVRMNLHIPAQPGSVTAVRKFTRCAVANLEASYLAETVELLVSELVTNSIRHSGQGPDDVIEVNLIAEPDHLRCEVIDRGRGFTPPPPRTDPPDVAGGWGLYIVGKLSERWGVQNDGEVCVWFELSQPEG